MEERGTLITEIRESLSELTPEAEGQGKRHLGDRKAHVRFLRQECSLQIIREQSEVERTLGLQEMGE